MGVFIVAECGVNWRTLDEAKKMIHTFAECGADACKFQMYRPHMVAKHPRAEELQRITMTKEMAGELKTYGETVGIEVFFTPMYPEAVDDLESLYVNRYKVRAKDATNTSLMKKVLSTGKDVIISVAGDRLDWASLDETKSKYRVKLLYCIDRYPAKDEEVHLASAFPAYRSYQSSVEYSGLSDHSPGISCSIAAAAMGAQIIEKHVMLDRSYDWIDAPVSVTPVEFKDMVHHIRRIEVLRR